MDYNTQRPKLIMAEYGRYVQDMVEYCKQIEDDDEPTTEEIDAECVFHATCADCPYQPYCDTVEEEEDDDDEDALYALIAQMRRALGQ